MKKKSILITGAGAGIGADLVDKLSNIFFIIAIDINKKSLESLNKHQNPSISCYECDLTNENEINNLLKFVSDKFPKVYSLINCAGIYPTQTIFEIDASSWDHVLKLNLRAPFLLTQGISKLMIKSNIKGSIINISSSAAKMSRPGICHYGASKAGLEQLTKNLAIELANYEIRVNTIAPGLINTETVQNMSKNKSSLEHQTKLNKIPLKRIGETDDLVGMVKYLLSPESSYCTGGVFPIDGGITLGITHY